MPKTKLALLLLAALLAGVCLGFFANSAIIKARIRGYSQMPADLPGHITARLAERLQLDAEQQKQVRAVFAAYEERMQETREKSRAMYDSLLAEMSIQIDQYLTPEQRTAQAYQSIAADLVGAGLSGADAGALAQALAGATKDEIAQAAAANQGVFELADDVRYDLPGTDQRRRLVVFRKISE